MQRELCRLPLMFPDAHMASPRHHEQAQDQAHSGNGDRVDQRIGETSRRLIRGRACGFSRVSPGEVSCAMHSSPQQPLPHPAESSSIRGGAKARPDHPIVGSRAARITAVHNIPFVGGRDMRRSF